jgi:hypothetical protein
MHDGELLALTKSEYLLAVNSPFRHIRSSGVQEFRSSGVQEFRSSGVQGGADRKITSRKTAVVENLRSTQSRPMQAPELLNFCNS